jgi:hypothetical protein
MILSIEFDEQEDLDKANEDKMVIECPCGANCLALRN